MKRANSLLVGTLLTFTVVACQQAAETNVAIDDPNATASIETLPPSEETGNLDVAEGNLSSRDSDTVAGMPVPPVINEAEDGGSENPKQAFFPAQYRGRWGMVAADCTSTRGDAKGLMTIGDTTVKFYESLAQLKEQRPAIATSFAGLFDFSGEGQRWTKVMTFTRTGNKLKRADKDGSFTYTRCT